MIELSEVQKSGGIRGWHVHGRHGTVRVGQVHAPTVRRRARQGHRRRGALGGTVLGGLSANALTILRRNQIGFVFQAFNLIPSLTARQNVELPRRLVGQRAKPGEVDVVLAAVGLTGRVRSGVHQPARVIADRQLERAPAPGRRHELTAAQVGSAAPGGLLPPLTRGPAAHP